MDYLEATLVSDDLPPDGQVLALAFDSRISQLYVATVDFISEDGDLDLTAILGKPVAVRVEARNLAQPLVVHGQIEVAEYVEARKQHHHYRLVLAPLIQALAHRVRSRIFQDKSALQIIEAVFKDAGIPGESLKVGVSGTFLPRAYCVQYQESELAFVMRLLEDEGIYFWFEHTDSGHVMHLGNKSPQQPQIEGEPLLEATPELHAEREAVSELVLTRSVIADAYFARDWSFESPDRPAEAKAELVKEPALESYEYPGYFQGPADGEPRAKMRGEELAIPARVLTGESNSLRLAAGRIVTFAGGAIPQMDGDRLLVAVGFRYRAPFFDSDADQAAYLRASFESIDAATPFRPARVTPRPRVWGAESAVVTGPPGEEIHVDEYGRIKVHFFWDREGKIDDKASCWIRVQQQNTAGSMLLPRVGWEMSIGFLDGDPDRPIVLQKLYNRETMPPYAMPGNKTQGALQSATSPGGGATNEIRMQDGSGGMEFFVHSSKDLAVLVANNATEEIKVDVHEEIGLKLDTRVGVDEKVKVGAAQSVSVTGSYSEDTVANKTVTVGAMDDWGVTSKFGIKTNGNRTESIGGMMNVLANQVTETYNSNYKRTVGAVLSMNTASALVEAVGGSKTETVGGAKMELIAKAKAEDVKGSKTLTSGLVTEKTGADIAVSAKSALTLSVGGPIVEKIDGDFQMDGAGVMVTSAGGAEIKVGGTSVTAKSGKITIKASSVAGGGGPMLKLVGRIDYKE